MVKMKIIRISKDKEQVHLEFTDGSVGHYKLETLHEYIPDIANADEWNTPCPSDCENNVTGIINYLGDRYGFCSNCNTWYNLDTGETCDNPLDQQGNDNSE